MRCPVAAAFMAVMWVVVRHASTPWGAGVWRYGLGWGSAAGEPTALRSELLARAQGCQAIPEQLLVATIRQLLLELLRQPLPHPLHHWGVFPKLRRPLSDRTTAVKSLAQHCHFTVSRDSRARGAARCVLLPGPGSIGLHLTWRISDLGLHGGCGLLFALAVLAQNAA